MRVGIGFDGSCVGSSCFAQYGRFGESGHVGLVALASVVPRAYLIKAISAN